MNTPPTSLLEAIRYFTDADNCLQFVSRLRWPDGPTCPECGGKEVSFLSTRRLWKCKSKHAKRQFSVKVGTIFEDSPIGLDKWLAAIWMICNCKNGISSYEIARDLKVTQKSAWFMLQRIRRAMQSGTFCKLSGQIEADETFIGGKARFMHKSKRAKVAKRGASGKTIVVGVLERGGKVRAKVIETREPKHVQKMVRENVQPGSALYTDEWSAYFGLSPEYSHEIINHAEAYVQGQVHTNGMENFWSLLKRGLKGTYVNVRPFHLFRYIDEQVYRYNSRKLDDAGRFMETVSNIAGRRLTWKELTGSRLQ
jgi:transposase-like protein